MSKLRLSQAAFERFRAFVEVGEPEECWEWTGARNDQGYGVFRAGRGQARRLLLAHRIAYSVAWGPLGRLHVLHICDNPSCVNPAHLRAGTQGDNVRDMIAKGRAAWQR